MRPRACRWGGPSRPLQGDEAPARGLGGVLAWGRGWPSGGIDSVMTPGGRAVLGEWCLGGEFWGWSMRVTGDVADVWIRALVVSLSGGTWGGGGGVVGGCG